MLAGIPWREDLKWMRWYIQYLWSLQNCTCIPYNASWGKFEERCNPLLLTVANVCGQRCPNSGQVLDVHRQDSNIAPECAVYWVRCTSDYFHFKGCCCSRPAREMAPKHWQTKDQLPSLMISSGHRLRCLMSVPLFLTQLSTLLTTHLYQGVKMFSGFREHFIFHDKYH